MHVFGEAIEVQKMQEPLTVLPRGRRHEDAILRAAVAECGPGTQLFQRGFEERNVGRIRGRDDDSPPPTHGDVEATGLLRACDADDHRAPCRLEDLGKLRTHLWTRRGPALSGER